MGIIIIGCMLLAIFIVLAEWDKYIWKAVDDEPLLIIPLACLFGYGILYIAALTSKYI